MMIKYVDGEGQPSERTVSFQCFGQAGNGCVYLLGFCHERNDLRHFRVDRIVNIKIRGERIMRHHEIVPFFLKKHGRDFTQPKRIAFEEGIHQPTIYQLPEGIEYITALDEIGGLPYLPTERQFRAVARLGLEIPFLMDC
jgi:predicted DNA-binding transcriptional regulator YafY